MDPRGRTPLMLAVTLGYLECSQILLANNADANSSNSEGWTVVQEAVSTGTLPVKITELLNLLNNREIKLFGIRIF